MDAVQIRSILRDRCPVIAEEWHRAIMLTSYALPGKMQARRRLLALTQQLIELLLAEPFEPAPAQAIGETLVALHYIQPKVLGNTCRVLNRSLFEGLSPAQTAALCPRLTLLFGEIATGFFNRAREVILYEQEQILGALMTARRETEKALAWQADVNAAMAELSRRLLQRAAMPEISALVLDSARHLTDSALGFVGFLDAGSGQVHYPAQVIKARDVSDLAEQGCRLTALDGLQRWLFERPGPILTNVPEEDLPESDVVSGDVPIRRLLAVPALLKGQVVGQLALANAERDYTEADQALLERLASLYALAIQQMRAEQQLEQAQEQLVRSERLAAIGELAASVAHELRNPLSVMQTSVYYITNRLSDADPKVLRSFARLERQIAATERIIRDLLEFAQVQPPELRPVDLNQILRVALASVTVPPDVTVETQLAQDLSPIPLDPDQMNRVFFNLMTNAVQAMGGHEERPARGRLVVSSGRASGQVVVSISDTGGGIPDEDLPHIFEPLYTTKAQGTGLGLAICRRVVEAHGGQIKVETQVGRGSTFTVKLPLTASVD